MVGWVIVEGDVAGRIVKMDGGYYELGDRDCVGGFGDEGEEGDEVVVSVVGLVVANYAWW